MKPTLLLLLILISILPGCSASKSDTDGSEIQVIANDLYKAYQANEVKADQIYKGKVLVVGGEINNIGRLKDGNIGILMLPADQYAVNGVLLKFSKEHEATIAELRTGQTIFVKGTCAGKDGGNVVLTNCVITRRVR